MSIVQMKKIRLLTHRSVTTDVLRAIQKLGIVEFVEVSDKTNLTQKEKSAFEFNYVSSRLDFAIEFLAPYAPKKGKIAQMIEGDREPTTGTHLYEVANSFYYNEIINQAQEIQEKLNNAHAKIKELIEEKELLQEWTGLEQSLATPRETAHTTSYFLYGKNNSVAPFTELLENEGVFFAQDAINIRVTKTVLAREFLNNTSPTP